MLFNSIEFAFFLTIVFLIYWFVVNKNINISEFVFIACQLCFLWQLGLEIFVPVDNDITRKLSYWDQDR